MKSYTELFKDIFNTQNNDDILVKMYITLLFLNNDHYSLNDMKKEIETTKIILTKVNNLKVKIQLKRKEKEINSLIDDIKKTVNSSFDIVCNYINDKDELFNSIDSLEPKRITDYIDRITRLEINSLNDIDNINNKRINLINLIKDNSYCIKNNKFVIVNEEIELYLLNINNYDDVYKSDNINKERKSIIEKIIDCINNNCDNKDIIIPIGLSFLITNMNQNSINASDFVIENIKISDLYSLANKKCIDKNTSKWRNVNIPNEYLFDKIKKIVNSGMYYYKDNKFVLELVENKVSDFKISIDIDKMKLLLKNTINV